MVVMLRLIYGHSDALQGLDLSSLLHLLVLCDRYDAPWCLRLTCAHLTSSPLVGDMASADEVIAFIDVLPHLRSASGVTELLAHAREVRAIPQSLSRRAGADIHVIDPSRHVCT